MEKSAEVDVEFVLGEVDVAAVEMTVTDDFGRKRLRKSLMRLLIMSQARRI